MGITYPDGTTEAQTKWYTGEADEDYIRVMGVEMLAVLLTFHRCALPC